METVRKLQYFTGIAIYFNAEMQFIKFIEEAYEYFDSGVLTYEYLNANNPRWTKTGVCVHVVEETQKNGKPFFRLDIYPYKGNESKFYTRMYLEFEAFKTGESYLGVGDWMYQVRYMADGAVFYETTRVQRIIDGKMADLENGVRVFIKPVMLLEGCESFNERDGQLWNRCTYNEINVLRLKNNTRRAKLWFEKKVFTEDEILYIYKMFN
jgi:hypothetical protein